MEPSKPDLEMSRSHRMLRTALGPLLLARLEDPGVAEVMLNPDGAVWIDRFDVGLRPADLSLSPADGERIIRLVAHHVGVEVHAGRPRLAAELPGGGERFEGLLPPLVSGPTFSLRKPASVVFPLGDYVEHGVMRAASVATSWSWVPPPAARPPWSMLCWPRSPRSMSAWS